MTSTIGIVYLVGAGPGDPGLLTMRGAECLRSADVILYDYLTSAELLAFARRDAEQICLGRHGQGRLMSQSEINDAMVRHASAGRTVVRLKGGDPAIFARLAEELDALHAAGVPYEIVPGVTAAQAASSHAVIPLTQRDEASCVAFVTGHETREKVAAKPLDYDALAKFPGTLVFYMGVTTAADWSRALIDHGKPPATPTALVRKCSLPDQEIFYTTLSEIGELVRNPEPSPSGRGQGEGAHLRPPAVVIVGDVAQQRERLNWFTSRPLFGRTVLVTRPEHQSDDLAARLRNLGANVLRQPAIEIGPPNDWAAVDRVIGRLADFDWLVFSSSNGVDYFLGRLLTLGRDMRYLDNVRLAAIGPATVAALAQFHLKADVQPDMYRAEVLAEALIPQVRDKRVLLARASRGREVLAEMLAAAGAMVEQVVVYESRDVTTPNEDVAHALAEGRIDYTTVTSSAIARSLVNLFGDHLRKTHLAAISPLTASILSNHGFSPAIVAKTFTTDGVVDAILAAVAQQSNSQ
ncbi:MAG TPA: uroporphyrinogen-III C-methyltransferase [Lacipirellulaceae bacterium]|nr:uroporphyrinogen-III C-methyltransferase [Lacipirellulaceae bacterium]